MTRLGHLSDLHIDGTAVARARLRRAMHRLGPAVDHFVITGDLTDTGSLRQFKDLADVLAEWPAHAITLVPGNHDGQQKQLWRDMLDGPLRPYALTSTPGLASDFGDVIIVPLDTQCEGRALLFSAMGHLDDEQLERVHRVAGAGKCVVLAMHHGPQGSPLQWFDGLQNRNEILAVLAAHPNVFVLSGHDHRALDCGQIFTVSSVSESEDPLRIYDVVGTRLRPVYRGARGHYMKLLGF